MRAYLEGGRQEEFAAGLARLTGFLRAARGKHNIAAAGVYMSMASLLINHINRMGLMGKVEANMKMERLMDLDGFADWQEAAGLLNEFADMIFDIRNVNRTKRAASVIDKVKKYVRENISGDLSLVHLADLVHFNPQYLSKLFKDTEGINLIDFISGVRIEKAKQMLENPACKVQDVALAAGYSNTANFCRFFRKHTGVAPNEYREK
jgi:two-component system, response regulator YesN